MPTEPQKRVARFRAGEYVEVPISDPQGKWVRYSDYEQLESRLAQVEKEQYEQCVTCVGCGRPSWHRKGDEPL